MLLSGVSVFFIWWVKATEDVVVILGCLFNAISIAGWNALNVLNAQSYPTELRSVEMFHICTHVKCLQCVIHHFKIMILLIINSKNSVDINYIIRYL